MVLSWTSVRRKLKNVTINKCLLVLLLSVIFFNEVFVYTLQTFRWNSIPDQSDGDMVMLMVSDPQIIGIQEEMGFPVGPLARWDSDRYLRNTFSRAFRHTRPDVIIFLGDITDEGSIATDTEFASYVHRFKSIFHEIERTKAIIIPGDNDIGGEGGDFRTPFKVHRFERNFENITGLIAHGFIDFLKLDIRQQYDSVQEKKQLISSFSHRMKAPIRMILNHESMLVKIKSEIYPSKLLTCDGCLSDTQDRDTWPYRMHSLEAETDYIDFDFSDSQALNELMVPTCSYRMGVPNMGYGVAIVNKSGSMKYTVLWLPHRYTFLYLYLYVLGFIVVVLLIKFILSPLNKQRKHFYS